MGISETTWYFIISSQQQVFTSLRYNNTVTYTYLPNWVVGGVDDDSLRLRVEFTGKLIWVKNPVSTRDRLSSRLLLK